ncbi:50S ribosomal protein L24 [Oceanomicrobium pacificus]|uniref:Large ribosomal subunit protein uL24 n=1 Tax=Oceanomicrobium pacificus TaxID=2692916 RepID=A0A6B0TYP4_9RHOB|nr:50S ribosomal protein L24 [Oceanomicrobium pacificus]MXU66392.1 50S ribosomal protein L24 [Oceanomicrobium pacificus]
MAAKLRKGDKVVVLAGKDKGKEGEIIAVMPKAGKAKVSGINMVVRHTKQSQSSQGGRLPQEAAIDLSNIALVDPKEGGPTRVGFKIEGDKKVRYAKKSGEVING